MRHSIAAKFSTMIGIKLSFITQVQNVVKMRTESLEVKNVQTWHDFGRNKLTI